MGARVFLFVPGDRPDRFERAFASGADAVVIDLEDAVAPEDRDAARRAARQALESAGDNPVGLRVNALTTPDGIRDLAALLDSVRPAFVVLPKVESAAEVRLCAEVLGGPGWRGELVCVIESGLGLERAAEIAAADPHVAALGFGGVDLAAALGAELAWEPLLPARGRLVWAAASAGVGAVDVPCLDLDSPSVLAEECRRARAMGFTGKIAIHPKQIAAIRAGFTPTAEQIVAAREVLRSTGDGRATRHRGTMVDAAVLRAARRILERADAEPGEV